MPATLRHADPRSVSSDAFPDAGAPAEKLHFLLNYAVLAPSSHNSQPWLFHLKDDAVALYADRSRALPVADPDDRELIMSCGAALANLWVAIRHFGYWADVETLLDPPQPDLLVPVRHVPDRLASSRVGTRSRNPHRAARNGEQPVR
ncbi:MAG: hypothetical protein HY704_08670 [Gemmatimonadetes bacterium]|nr:hypothetical protein [Gemmatimonadota bacterium]